MRGSVTAVHPEMAGVDHLGDRDFHLSTAGEFHLRGKEGGREGRRMCMKEFMCEREKETYWFYLKNARI